MSGLIAMSITIKLVHQKVGRNLLLFQKLEYTLKTIVAMSEVSGHASDIERNKEDRKAWVMKLTLGQNVGEHVESFNPSNEQLSEPPPSRKEPYLSIRHSFECDDIFLENRKSVLAGFVKERNELVHHLPTNYDLNDEESLHKLIEILDDQHSRLKKEVALVFEYGKNQFELHKELGAFLQSEEGRRLLEEGLNEAKVIDRQFT